MYRAIEVDNAAISADIARRHLALEPQIWQRYGESGVKKCEEDASYLLSFLAEALAADDPALFVAYVRWAAVLLRARSIATEHLATNLRLTSELLASRFANGDLVKVKQFLNLGLDALAGEETSPSSFLEGDAVIDVLARNYLSALLRMERGVAYALIIRALDEGISIRDLYLGVFERVQYEIGRLWQINAIGVAQEHYCTAATQSIIARLYEYVNVPPSRGKSIIAICVSGELHEIGLRIVCDFLEMEGWRTIYVGANTPAPDLIRIVEYEKVGVLAISATMTFHLQRVREIIDAVRKSGQAVKIIVGGLPFRMSSDLWKVVGADGFAESAAELPALMSRLEA